MVHKTLDVQGSSHRAAITPDSGFPPCRTSLLWQGYSFKKLDESQEEVSRATQASANPQPPGFKVTVIF